MRTGINNQNIYELWMENKQKVFIILIIIIIGLILIFNIKPFSSFNYSELENKIVNFTKDYIDKNKIEINEQVYVDLFQLENSGYELAKEVGGKCQLGSGILIENNGSNLDYIPYLMCDNYQSAAVLDIANITSSKIKLLGNKMMFISQTEEYLDPGYETTDNSTVEISGNVTNKPGLYLVNYTIQDSNNSSEPLSRIVVVTSYNDYLEDDGLFITLLGENGGTITEGTDFIDPGVLVIDKKDGNITNKINVKNYIDTSKYGSYNIKYTVTNSSSKSISIERIVNVIPKVSNLQFTSSVSPTTITNQGVNINIEIKGDDYYRALLPNNLFTYAHSINYKVNSNGTYNFKIYTKNGEIKTKAVTVSNIDKTSPHGSCSGIVENEKTILSVISNDNVEGYIFKAGTSSSSKITDSTYVFNFESRFASVNIYDKAGNFKNITCQLNIKKTEEVPIPKNPNEYNEPYTPPTSTNPGSLTKNSFTTTRYGNYNFWLYLPHNASTKKMPLVIFLHGRGENGTNLNSLTSVGLMKYLKEGYQYDAIIAAPQNAENLSWTGRISVVKDLIDYLIRTYKIDEDRISITGHSLGGMGAYAVAAKYPDLLSCIAPVSGRGSTNLAPALVSTPILAYHGDQDRSVPYSVDKSLVNAVKALGGNATLITLTGKGHAIANQVYKTPDLINWMIAQKR